MSARDRGCILFAALLLYSPIVPEDLFGGAAMPSYPGDCRPLETVGVGRGVVSPRYKVYSSEA